MSCVYRIATKGARLSLEKIERIAKAAGGELLPVTKMNVMDRALADRHRVVRVSRIGYIHVYRTGKAAWNDFERFGANYVAAQQWVEFLNASGYSVLSEHDEGY